MKEINDRENIMMNVFKDLRTCLLLCGVIVVLPTHNEVCVTVILIDGLALARSTVSSFDELPLGRDFR